ncbi:hypothetical protein B7494_g1127 [Chlorociboria aeruginascens]|nr:hypothetical protein B7494_g1127 [Chlorociboria aeruginascens]
MSEYWKSTPNYWCKHCKTYVRDTKLEKSNHEATPRHQGNLKRFLRDLHRGHEKDEKDKLRAKDEVARLNGLVTGGEAGASSSSSGYGTGSAPLGPKPQATAEQRKEQLAQLAQMGIEIPDEFRGDLAMAGQWQITSEREVVPEGEKNPDSVVLGVRKREVEEEEEDEVVENKRRNWASTHRTHPAEDEGDLDVLLSQMTRGGKKINVKAEINEVKVEVKEELESIDPSESSEHAQASGIKMETEDGESILPLLDTILKKEGEELAVPGVIFKKRKAKNIRQK